MSKVREITRDEFNKLVQNAKKRFSVAQSSEVYSSQRIF
jgi:hypothetical protein